MEDLLSWDEDDFRGGDASEGRPSVDAGSESGAGVREEDEPEGSQSGHRAGREDETDGSQSGSEMLPWRDYEDEDGSVYRKYVKRKR